MLMEKKVSISSDRVPSRSHARLWRAFPIETAQKGAVSYSTKKAAASAMIPPESFTNATAFADRLFFFCFPRRRQIRFSLSGVPEEKSESYHLYKDWAQGGSNP